MNRSDMRRFFLFLLTAIAVAACTSSNEVELKGGKLSTERPGEFYYGAWNYGNSKIGMAWINGGYYIVMSCYMSAVQTFGSSYAVYVSFDDADRATSWIESQYSKLNDIMKQMKENEVEEISKTIAIEDPGLFYFYHFYHDAGYYSDGSCTLPLSVNTATINIDLGKNPHVEMSLGLFYDLKISDKTYPVMMDALKNRHKMKKQLEAYVNEQLDKERRKRELENSIW